MMRATVAIMAMASIVCGLVACSPTGNGADQTNVTQMAASKDRPADDEAEPVAQGDNVDTPSRSILRPEIAEPDPASVVAEPVEAVIPFGGAGSALDDAGRTALDTLIADPAVMAGGAITLRGHSDSRGGDRANLTASQKRAEAVRDYLVGKGIGAERITVIAMGETAPLVANARSDGSDDPDARAKNRRVDVHVALPLTHGAGDESPHS